MRIAYLGPAGTFTEDALGEAAPSAEFEPLRTATIHDAILAVQSGRGRARPGPLRELDRGLGPRHPRHPRLRGRRGDDRRRARLRGAGPPDRPRAGRAGRDRGSPLPPAASRPVRAIPARAAGRGRTAQRQQHRGGGADGRRVGPPLGGDRLPRRGRALRLPDPARGDPGRGRQRHPLRLDRPGRDRPGRGQEPGRPRWSSPSSARTTRAPWSTPCESSQTARST